MTDKTQTYPYVPTSAWRELRARFHQSMPREVTPSYVASALNTSEQSAAGNVINPLKRIGILDGDGRPTTLARRWHLDEDYADVCAEIRKTIYPEELLDLASGSKPDRSVVERWLRQKTQQGTAGVNKMAIFYMLLSEGDATALASAKSTREPAITRQAIRNVKKKSTTVGTRAQELPESEATSPHTQSPVQFARRPGSESLSLHVDVQIHIASDASVEQIDAIFSSMSKHLYDRK
jgi:hypothetical protein